MFTLFLQLISLAVAPDTLGKIVQILCGKAEGGSNIRFYDLCELDFRWFRFSMIRDSYDNNLGYSRCYHTGDHVGEHV